MDALARVLPPPQHPVEVPDSPDWIPIEGRLGTPLPPDYIEFVRRYGTGVVSEFLWIHNPWSRNVNLSLLDRHRLSLPMLRELIRLFPEQLPFAVFPETPGLLPFGGTDNGHILAWNTTGNPPEWTVTVVETMDFGCHRHPGPMAHFLLNVLTGKSPCPLFPEEFFAGRIPSFGPLEPGRP